MTDEAHFDAILRPHRSLSAKGFKLLLGVLIVFNAAFAIVMVAQGAWPVAGFMGLDVLGVYIAFRLSYAQARAMERILIDGPALIVRRIDERGRVSEWQCPAYWASVDLREDDDHERGVLTVRSHGREFEIAKCLSPAERTEFATVLREALRRAKASPARA